MNIAEPLIFDHFSSLILIVAVVALVAYLLATLIFPEKF